MGEVQLVNPNHIRIAFDGRNYWVERKVLTTAPDPFGRRDFTVVAKWKHVYGYLDVDGSWLEDPKLESSRGGVFVCKFYTKKEEVLEAVRALCTHITYFDANGNNINDDVEFPKSSAYIMDQQAKRYYEERSEGKRT